MLQKRRQHSLYLKAQVGLEALKNIDNIQSIAAKYEVHQVRLITWKKKYRKDSPILTGPRQIKPACETVVSVRRSTYI